MNNKLFILNGEKIQGEGRSLPEIVGRATYALPLKQLTIYYFFPTTSFYFLES
jgi:hypothetical protein